jgi:ribokinase
MAKHLLVVGSANADLYVEIERLPQPGETLPGGNAAVRPGGKGANQAAAAARLGLPTRFAGRFGSDAFASPLRAALTDAGVDLAPSRDVPGPTGQAFILLQQGGENSIVLVGGANRAWEAAPRFDLAGAGALLLQREIPEAVNRSAAVAARAAGVPVVLDCGGDDAPLPPDLLPLIDVVSPNESELARLTGLPTEDDEQVLAAARWLQARGVGTVLVKLGSRGCLLVPRTGEPLRQAAFKVAAVDTTGAGDCFTGAYTVGLVEGLPEMQRLRLACAAAALCVQGLGAMPSMPTRAATEAFLATQS